MIIAEKAYFIHSFADSKFKHEVMRYDCNAKNRKAAMKKMIQIKCDDLVKGNYYFYVVIEQKNYIVEVTK
jgi:hypothetical protein